MKRTYNDAPQVDSSGPIRVPTREEIDAWMADLPVVAINPWVPAYQSLEWDAKIKRPGA